MKSFILYLFISLCLVSKAQTDSIPVLNTLRYLDLGIGAGLPDGETPINAGLSLDINDILALFAEYNLYLKDGAIHLHESSLKVGPYHQFGWNSYFALTSGFSVLFTTSGINEFFYSIPLQLRINLGMNDFLSLGIKGTYNMVLTDGYGDRGSVIVFMGIKFRN